MTKTNIKLPDGSVVEAEVREDVDLAETEVVLADGSRLTEDVAEEMAEEALARHRSRGGRPSLSAGVSPRVAFRVPADLRQKLAEAAEQDQVGESEVMRRALAQYLATR